MANNNAAQFRAIYSRYLTLRGNAPRIVGGIAVNFFKASFKNQGQKINGSIRPWQKRGAGPSRRKGRKMLIDEGTLSRSPMIKSANTGRVVIGIDAAASAYAKLMNDGGTVPITMAMRKFFWAMYYDAAGRGKQGAKATQALSEDAQFWKNMALTKKKELKFPARPFIYDSKDLVDDITHDLMKRINKIVNFT